MDLIILEENISECEFFYTVFYTAFEKSQERTF